MDEPETNDQKSQEPEANQESKRVESVGDIELEAGEAAGEESAEKPGFLEGMRQSFQHGWQANGSGRKGTRNRQELRKDKTKTLVGLAAFTSMMIVLFVLVFSSPPKRQQINSRPPGTPDLGQRVTPGQGGPHANVTPLMNPTPAGSEGGSNGLATAQDIADTARPLQASSGVPGGSTSTPLSAATSPRPTLAQISFQDRALQQQYAMGGTNPPVSSTAVPSEKPDELKTPSLVFVRASMKAANLQTVEPAFEENTVMDLLPVGTHLVARLEAPVSTALEAPAVAVIEYNYEQNGEIILPAGTQVIGKLRGATPQGDVSIEFDEVQFQDGATQKIDATAMGLDYRPLKGHVTGRNRGLRFLVQSLTGVGEMAAYMVGGSPASTSVFSEDALLRQQLAANMAMAGQQQFNELAMTQHIVVTVPGNTRFYLVLEQGTTPQSASAAMRPYSKPSNLPSEQELMELMELKRELAASTSGQAAAVEPAAASAQQ